MYLFYILCSGPSISITHVGWARNNAVFQVSLSVGSLKVLDGEWEKRFEGPRRETQQSTSISPALTFGNTKNKGVRRPSDLWTPHGIAYRRSATHDGGDLLQTRFVEELFERHHVAFAIGQRNTPIRILVIGARLVLRALLTDRVDDGGGHELAG